MIGIILASHGDFANGILQSATMIFGQQEEIATVTLQPSEGPEVLHDKMQKSIASFKSKEVLFLVDLWGGTPFNQASTILKGHEDKWAILTGLNLPMLIEALSMRGSSDNAHDIAKKLLPIAKDGVNVLPKTLDVKPALKTQTTRQPKAGSGKMKFVLSRIDSRLLHGQVATSWTKSLSPDRIIVVSDKVAKDDLRKELIVQAAPPGVKANVIPIDKLIAIYNDPRFNGLKVLLLFETPMDALRILQGGVPIKEINVGSMAHSVGKVAVSKAISLDNDDIAVIEEIKKLGVRLDVRKVPADSAENMDSFLKKAKAELAKQKSE